MSQAAQKFSLVLGEGKEDLAVLQKVAEAGEINGLRYKEYGGKNKLKSFLNMEQKAPEYTSGRIKRILITRDADENWQAAWDAASGAAQNIFGVVISAPGEWQQIENGPQVSIWIAPSRDKEGMIETLCLEAAKNTDSDTFDCLETYVECLQTKHQIELHEKERFEIWTIAAQGSAMGRRRLPFSEAITRLPIDWSNSAFTEIKDLLDATSAS